MGIRGAGPASLLTAGRRGRPGLCPSPSIPAQALVVPTVFQMLVQLGYSRCSRGALGLAPRCQGLAGGRHQSTAGSSGCCDYS